MSRRGQWSHASTSLVPWPMDLHGVSVMWHEHDSVPAQLTCTCPGGAAGPQEHAPEILGQRYVKWDVGFLAWDSGGNRICKGRKSLPSCRGLRNCPVLPSPCEPWAQALAWTAAGHDRRLFKPSNDKNSQNIMVFESLREEGTQTNLVTWENQSSTCQERGAGSR